MTRSRIEEERHATTDRPDPRASSDHRLIGRIGAAYEPQKLTASARYTLERNLWERIERRRRPALFRPVLAMVTVVATVLWFARPPSDSDTLTMAAAVVDAWEYDILYSDSVDDHAFDWGESAGLPEDFEDLEMLIGTDTPDEGNGT
jgi:hypothetical protein